MASIGRVKLASAVNLETGSHWSDSTLFTDIVGSGKEQLDFEELIAGRVVLGSPEEVAEELIDLARATGFTRRVHWLGVDQHQVLRTIELLAERVIPMAKGITSAADIHGLEVEHLSVDEMASRFPGFSLPEDWAGIYEPNGGVLQAEIWRHTHVDLAISHGADLRFGCAVTGWKQNASGNVVITTTEGEFEAKSMILTLGPWACNALRDLDLPLTGRRIPIIHYEAIDPTRYRSDDMSVYFWATPEGVYAGFPHFDGEGVKIMRHDTGDVCTPETARRDVSEADIKEISDLANKYMPYANRSVRKSLIGLYTMTPDNHFIIDHHPGFNNVAYATGFSGHGFKFSPVIGEILADMVLEGATRHPTEFLVASRFTDQQLKSA